MRDRGQDVRVRVAVEIEFDGPSVRGTLTDPGGERRPFDSWLALHTLLRGLAPQHEGRFGGVLRPAPAGRRGIPPGSGR